VNDARPRHPWLRINRVLRVMLQTRWSAEAWSVVRVEFRKSGSRSIGTATKRMSAPLRLALKS
jgi:hypothetical protein